MGAGHAQPLYLPGTSPLHRARPQCKIAATLLFVLAVVATPREAFWAFGLYALTLIGIGEGIITALTVGVVLGVRPDLVYGAADLQTPLVLGPKPSDTAREVS